jgi:hypothetical protein
LQVTKRIPVVSGLSFVLALARIFCFRRDEISQMRQSVRKVRYRKQKKVRKKLTSLEDEFYARYQAKYGRPEPQESGEDQK